jgi:hypothetical protein
VALTKSSAISRMSASELASSSVSSTIILNRSTALSRACLKSLSSAILRSHVEFKKILAAFLTIALPAVAVSTLPVERVVFSDAVSSMFLVAFRV